MKILFKTLIFSIVTLFSFQVSAQDEILDFLLASEEDAEKLTELYTRPLFKGFGYGLANGWYQTAGTHKTLGFALDLTVGAAFIPSSDNFFNFKNSAFNSVRLEDSQLQEAKSPTVFGPDQDGPLVEIFDDNNNVIGTINLPPGVGLEDEIGFSAVPTAIPQLSVGVIKNTDIMIRFMPEIGVGDDGRFKYWGLGVKHDIKQWIPGMKLIPMHLSVMVGYTNIDANVDLTGTLDGQDQEGVYNVNAMTFQVLASKKFSVITFYGGLGFNTVKSDVDILGIYDVLGTPGDQTDDLVDPISIKIKDSGVNMTLGFRLKFAFFTIHGDYTFSDYNAFTTGIGFSIRENGSVQKPLGG